MPIIGGYSEPYIISSMTEYKMKPKFNKLDKTEIEALLNFYASPGTVCPYEELFMTVYC